MRIKSVASLCKKSKSIYLVNNDDSQWIGDGYAIYKLFGLPKLEEEHVYTMFDIPEDKRAGFHFGESPLSLDTRDTDEKEEPLQRSGILITSGGATYEPLTCSIGTVNINTKYLSPLDDAENGTDLFIRGLDTSSPYIAAKDGFLITAIIAPRKLSDKKLLQDLNDIVLGLKIVSENEMFRTGMEEENENDF